MICRLIVAHLEAALDDVIAIQIPDEVHHPRPKSLDHQSHLRAPLNIVSLSKAPM